MRHVRKPRVITKKNDPMMTHLLIKQLQFDKKNYWPLFFAPGGWTQVLVFLIISRLSTLWYFLGFRKYAPSTRTVVTTSEGDAVLNWFSPPAGCETKPVVVVFPGVTGKRTDFPITQTIDLLLAAGYEVVLYNRRCHENESFYFSIIGDPNMTDKILAVITKDRPERGIFLLGFSAGTGSICRYIQDLAIGTRENLHDVRFASMISPGYTTDLHPEANFWALNPLVSGMNQLFLSSIHDAKAPKIAERLQGAKGIKEWIEIAGELSGYGTIESYREHCCPGTAWSRIDAFTDAELSEMKYFPSVVFSARDDIFFPWGYVKRYLRLIRKMHSLALIDTDFGSHCTYFDNFADNWAVRMSISIFDQVVKNDSKGYE